MNHRSGKRIAQRGWIFVALAVALGGAALVCRDIAGDGPEQGDVDAARTERRLLLARLDFERAGSELLTDRMLVGLGVTADDPDRVVAMLDRLSAAHGAIADIAAGDGPIAEEAALVVEEIDAQAMDEIVAGSGTALYDAVDSVRWSTEGVPVTSPFDVMFEMGFFAQLPQQVFAEALAGYAEVGVRPAAPDAAELFDAVGRVVRQDGGWFGADAMAPLTDSEWFDVEHARTRYPDTIAAVEAAAASSDLVVVDRWMRELGDSDTAPPMPIDELVAVVDELQRSTIRLIDPVITADSNAIIADMEAEAHSGVLMMRVAQALGAVAAIFLGLGLLAAARRHRSLRKLSDLALRDALTGVGNRHALATTIADTLQDSRYEHHVVVAIDIDRFKMVNDLYGHGAGDTVLQEVARRLQASIAAVAAVSPSTIGHVVRVGGDEFIMSVHAAKEVPVDLVRAHLDDARRRAVSVQFEGRAEDFVPEFSIGVVECHGHADLQELMVTADLAAYADKAERAAARRAVDDSSPAATPVS